MDEDNKLTPEESEETKDSKEPAFDAKAYWQSLNQSEEEKEKNDDQPQEYWTSFSDHGISYSNDPGYGEIPEEYRSGGLSKAAFTCGILAIVTAFINLSLPFAAMGILLACLSRDRKFCRQAKVAIGMCTTGIVIFAAAMGTSIYLLVSTGMWDVMMDRISTVDVSDPYAIGELQRDLIIEFQDRLSARMSGEPYSGKETTAKPAEEKPRVVLGRAALEAADTTESAAETT